MLGGLTIYLLVANFLRYIMHAKSYENCLALDKVIAIIKGGALFVALTV